MRNNPDNAPQKKLAYIIRLEGMTDAELSTECGLKIWLSAYANNNPSSCYHWQADYCYNECARREKTDIYKAAYDAQLQRAS